MTTMRVSGLSLGQGPQSTALVYVEASKGSDGPNSFVSSLKRWAPGTSLTTIITDLRKNFDNALAGSSLVVDRTEVGELVVRHLKAVQLNVSNCRYYGIAHQTDSEKDTIARADLGDTIRLVRDSGRMEFAKELDSRELVMSACRNWQMKTLAAGPDALWRREGSEDDIMCALSMALWYVEQYGYWDGSPYVGPKTTRSEQIAERARTFNQRLEQRMFPRGMRGGPTTGW
jgi:hypothetical protein